MTDATSFDGARLALLTDGRVVVDRVARWVRRVGACGGGLLLTP